MRIVQAPSQDVIKSTVLTTIGDIVQRGVAVPERLPSAGPNYILKAIGAGTSLRWTENKIFQDINNAVYQTKILDIGPWNMVLNSFISVNHGLTFANIICCIGYVIDDNSAFKYLVSNFSGTLANNQDIFMNTVTSTVITIERTAGGTFDGVLFNDGVINRGRLFFIFTT